MSNINWPGLLKWSLRHTDGTTDVRRMSQEDMDFLSSAIQEALKNIEDPFQAIQETLPKLKSQSDEEVLTALAVLERCLDFPETARNIEKLDGVQPLLGCLSHQNHDVQEKSCEIFSLLLAHNPEIQEATCNRNGLDKFLALVDSNSQDMVRFRALSALAALTRHFPRAEKMLVDRNGFATLMHAVASGNPRDSQKAASLARHLVHEQRVPPQQVGSSDVSLAVQSCLGDRNVDQSGLEYGEVIAGFLEALVATHRDVLQQTKQLPIIKQAVEGRLQYLGQCQRHHLASRREAERNKPTGAEVDPHELPLDVSVEVDMLKSVLDKVKYA
ncbi:unnamed protein product [Vitrella brassicaformis CCMP3155]|uniref:Nucleotide exchange factor Fes1 domain-containing protein n=1 Tax=Vitrella brassicaformis (strain CCMP3155) TaxID=1169540 RepID=A0A0G4G575_VITBC|nr:unnamed protein product [Vitrella brassicaformis CCMP3155]|eukprot:CEM23654.1 unnamed protein product [Vitrella brassicaformis CCMP3155]